jgi:hypothetical protein
VLFDLIPPLKKAPDVLSDMPLFYNPSRVGVCNSSGRSAWAQRCLSTTLYPPFLLARMMGTLDHLTAGRSARNVVTSVSAAAAQNYGHDDLPEHEERYNIADEYLDLVRRLWDNWSPDAVLEDREKDIFAGPDAPLSL